MQLRTIGRSSLQVAPLCLGGNVFGWTADEAASFKILDAAVDAGLNFIDTADAYSAWLPGHQGGESETIIGNWLRKRARRKDVVIATKVGLNMPPDRKKGLSASPHRALCQKSHCAGSTPTISMCILPHHATIQASHSRKRSALFSSSLSKAKCASSVHRTTRRRAWLKLLRQVANTACRDSKFCSRSTTFMRALTTKPHLSRFAASSKSASSPTLRSPRVFSLGSIVSLRMRRRAHEGAV